MNKKIVVDGCTLKFKNPINSGTITIIPASLLSQKAKCSGNKIYKSVAFTVTGATNGTVTAATGAGVILGNSDKVKCDLLPIVLEDAESPVLTFTGVIGSLTGQTFTDNIIIDSIGQSKAKGK
jgi:hypothetical protein